MEPGFRFRLYLLTALVLVGFGALLSRLHEFQIIKRGEFLEMVPGNREETIREPGIRGSITDRHGVVLAKNIRRYEVSFNLEEIRKNHLVRRKMMTPEQLKAVDPSDIVSIVKDGEDSTIETLKEMDLATNFNSRAMKSHYLTHGGLIPYTYRTDLTFEQFSKIAEHNTNLPGVYVGVRPERTYPYGSLASHILGYLKQWEKGDIPDGVGKIYDHYVGDDKGIAGIEATMDHLLLGLEGRKTIVKDEKGRTIGMSDYIKPGMGAKVQLTLDARKQYLLENVLRRAGRAAGVIMDVNSGEVLAMASVPDYNPNAFIPSISPERWQAYRSSRQLSPLTNRAISEFAPGSTMKVPTAIAGALQGMARRSFSCDGYVAYGDHKVGCWVWNMRGGSHGTLSLSESLKRSCNPYFNKLSNTMGGGAMITGCQTVGIGKQTGIELPGESAGILPGSRAWRASNPGSSMTPVLTAFTSIGQGDTMATPLQMCAMTATVANGGKYYQPHLVRRAVAEDGTVVLNHQKKVVHDLVKEGISAEDFELIRQGMWKAANEIGGTASRTRLENIEVASKTGTAQTIDNGQKSNNAWVISFAPYENPKYAVCVMVQNGASGGGVAGPLVHLIYRGLFAKEEGLKLSLKRQTEYLGHTDRIEKMPLPEDVSFAINATDIVDVGQASAVSGAAVVVNDDSEDDLVPIPTLTTQADDGGTVVPRAIPVPEP